MMIGKPTYAIHLSSLSYIVQNVDELRDDLEEDIHKLTINDSIIRATFNHEIQLVQEEIDSINNKVETIKEMPIGKNQFYCCFSI